MPTTPRRVALLCAALSAGASACSATASAPASGILASERIEPPALVVLVVVDQLRGDLIQHYAPAFSEGFRRLLDDGFRFTGASHKHAVTETAAGHATLASGVSPRRHGIVANTWRERGNDGDLHSVYAVEDSAARVLGLPDFEGRSPSHLEHTGLADWVLAADPDARAVAVSNKDRSAIGLGGTDSRAHVYWIADGTARFVTSTYYTDAYPEWVTRFNAGPMASLYTDSVWTSATPAALTRLAGPDTAAWEGDGVHTAFPHLAAVEARPERPWGRYLWLDYTPVPDEAVLRFGLAAVDALDLGQRGATDLLALSFSSTDYVGHRYGPFSREQLDNLMRLDRRLGTLFETLDREVGEGRWVAALSADHGTTTTPERLRQMGRPGYRLTRADVDAMVAAVRAALEGGGGDGAVRERVVASLEALPRVAAAYRADRLDDAAAADSFAVLYGNSTYPGRYPGRLSHLGFEVRFEEGTLASVMARGTTHVGPYWPDRWVPLTFLGAGVRAGVSADAAYTYDVAPSLAALAGVPVPDDLDGRPLLPPLRSPPPAHAGKLLDGERPRIP